jgi:hypothetical protein
MNTVVKDRVFNNLKTTIPGAILLLFGLFLMLSKIMYVTGNWTNGDVEERWIVLSIVAAYGLISAKDSWVGGIFGIITKLFIKK